MSAFIVRLQKGAPKVSGPINLALDPTEQAAQTMDMDMDMDMDNVLGHSF